MDQTLTELLSAQQGHFALESGHHGDLWLNLDILFLNPSRLQPYTAQLAEQLKKHHIDAVCGPLVGGAFLAQSVATLLDVEFYYTGKDATPNGGDLYSVAYTLPEAFRAKISGKTVAIVDDVINAGSATRATFSTLQSAGATVIALAALLVLNDSAKQFAAANNIALIFIAQQPSGLWPPAACPLCATGVPLTNNLSKP